MKNPVITDVLVRRIYAKYRSLVFSSLPFTYETKRSVYMMENLGATGYIITYKPHNGKQWRIMCMFKVNEEGDEIISITR